MRFWHLFSLVSLAVVGYFLLIDLSVTDKKIDQSSLSEEFAVTKVPVDPLSSTVPANVEHCGKISKAHKHQIDDWLLALQTQDKLDDWQANLERLPACLHAITKDYLSYKQSLGEVDDNLNLHERLTVLKSLQTQYFSEQIIDAWFADENAWDSNALTRWQILSDKSLNAAQKNVLISAHLSQLPEGEKQLINSAQTFSQLAKQWQTMDYNQLRESYGDDAAQRLLQLQSQQLHWQQRVDDFKKQRDDIITRFEGAQQHEKVLALKQSLFSDNELKRLHILLDD